MLKNSLLSGEDNQCAFPITNYPTFLCSSEVQGGEFRHANKDIIDKNEKRKWGGDKVKSTPYIDLEISKG